MNLMVKLLIAATAVGGVISIGLHIDSRPRWRHNIDPASTPHARTATISGVYWKSKRGIRSFPVDKMAKTTDVILAIKEWIPDEGSDQLAALYPLLAHRFVLRAPRCPDVRLSLDGYNYSDPGESFQGFGACIEKGDRSKLRPGVSYSISPVGRGEIPWGVSGAVFVAPHHNSR